MTTLLIIELPLAVEIGIGAFFFFIGLGIAVYLKNISDKYINEEDEEDES